MADMDKMDALCDLNALCDEELNGEDRAKTLGLVQSSSSAHSELMWIRAVKSAVKDKCLRHDNPELFRACMSRVSELDSSRRIEKLVGRYAWAACAFVVATLLFGGLVSRLGVKPQLNQANMAGLLGSGLVAVPGGVDNPQQTVERTMGRMPFDVRPSGMAVREIAQGAIEGRQASRIRLTDGEGQLVLFVVEGVGGFEGQQPLRDGYGAGIINGAHAISWTDGPFGYLLVGARPTESLAALADGLREARP